MYLLLFTSQKYGIRSSIFRKTILRKTNDFFTHFVGKRACECALYKNQNAFIFILEIDASFKGPNPSCKEEKPHQCFCIFWKTPSLRIASLTLYKISIVQQIAKLKLMERILAADHHSHCWRRDSNLQRVHMSWCMFPTLMSQFTSVAN